METKKQKEKIAKVMHEFKEGELHIGTSDKIVKNPKQAMAIALSEAHASKMAKGGLIEDYNVVVKLPKGILTKKDFEGYTKQEIIDWCEQREWKYNPKGEKMGGRILKDYEFFVTPAKTYNKKLPKNKMADGGDINGFTYSIGGL